MVEEVLEADPADDFALDARLKSRGLSLRVVVREIPPVIGSFFGESRTIPSMETHSGSALRPCSAMGDDGFQ